MLEDSIVRDILQAAGEEVEHRGPLHFTAVRLKIGDLTAVDPNCLRTAYQQGAAGTALDGSQLEIEQVPVVVFCSHCHEERPVESIQFLRCANCGAAAVQVVGGRELELCGFESEELQTT